MERVTPALRRRIPGENDALSCYPLVWTSQTNSSDLWTFSKRLCFALNTGFYCQLKLRNEPLTDLVRVHNKRVTGSVLRQPMGLQSVSAIPARSYPEALAGTTDRPELLSLRHA